MAAELGPLDPSPERRFASLKQMRADGDVHPLGSGRYIAVSHETVATGLGTVDSFGGSAGQEGLPEEDTMIAGILEPRHGQIRRIINAVIAFHRSQKIEPYLRSFCAANMQAVLADGSEGRPVQVMKRYVDPLPPAAMARLLGFPEEDSAGYYKWGANVGQAFGRAAAEGTTISLRQASPEMAGYVDARIAERSATDPESWPQDALTRFLTTEVDGERLSQRAISTQVMFAIGAGSDTTRNALGSLLYRLGSDPDVYRDLRQDRSLIPDAIEEGLRLDAPAQFLVRQCLVPEFELGGARLREGDSVILSIGSANRDESVFSDPERYDHQRANLREHLTFGTGRHICPGSALARLELRVALETWCDHVEAFRIADGYEWEPPPTGMLHGPERLQLVITPA
jgi:cytochrome P450